MNPTQHRNRERIISRLNRLLWIMEGVANEGWSKSPIGRGTPNIEDATPGGDHVVSEWLQRLTQRIDDEIERYLRKLDEREEKLVGTTDENQAVSARRTRDAQGRLPTDRCPNCGTSITSAGAF